MPSRRLRRPVLAVALLAAALACGDDPTGVSVPTPFRVLRTRIATDLPTITAGGSGTTAHYVFGNSTDMTVSLRDPATGCARFVPAVRKGGVIYMIEPLCGMEGAAQYDTLPVPARGSLAMQYAFDGIISLGVDTPCALTGQVELVAIAVDHQGALTLLPEYPGTTAIAVAPLNVQGTGDRPACPPPGSGPASL